MKIIILGFILLVIAAVLTAYVPGAAAIAIVVNAGGWVALVFGLIVWLFELVNDHI